MVDIYLHLDTETLAAALANDQRSFSMELFKEATQKLQKNLSRSPADVTKFEALAEKAQVVVLENLKQDEEYNDAPEEYLGKYRVSKLILYNLKWLEMT